MDNYLLVFAGDTHTGDPVGLLPARGIVGEGGRKIPPTPFQKRMWSDWLKLWRTAKKMADSHQAKLVVVLMGDMVDWNKHTDRMLTKNRAALVRTAAGVLKPVEKVADEIYLLRGTEAHDGGEGELAELLGDRVKHLIPDEKRGTMSWYKLIKKFGGVLIRAQHHPPASSKREHTRGSGAMRSAVQVEMEAVRLGKQAPALVVFGHVHHKEDSGMNRVTRGLFIPAWKGHGPYEERGAFSDEPPGAWLVRIEDGEIDSVKFFEGRLP